MFLQPNFVESIVLNQLSRFSEKDLVWDINNNYRLIEGFRQDSSYKIFAQFKWMLGFFRKDIESLDTNKIIELLKTRRPDFYKHLNTTRGREWLQKQIWDFKKELLS